MNLGACLRTSRTVVLRVWVTGMGEKDLVVTKASIRSQFREWMQSTSDEVPGLSFWKEGHHTTFILIHTN